MTTLHLTLESRDGRTPVAFDVSDFVIAGWAGRNKEAMEHHIRELEALGVARPAATPTYYRVAAARLTTAGLIEDAGTAGSGRLSAGSNRPSAASFFLRRSNSRCNAPSPAGSSCSTISW